MGCYKYVTTNARFSPYSLETTCLIAPFMDFWNINLDYGLWILSVFSNPFEIPNPIRLCYTRVVSLHFSSVHCNIHPLIHCKRLMENIFFAYTYI